MAASNGHFSSSIICVVLPAQTNFTTNCRSGDAGELGSKTLNMYSFVLQVRDEDRSVGVHLQGHKPLVWPYKKPPCHLLCLLLSHETSQEKGRQDISHKNESKVVFRICLKVKTTWYSRNKFEPRSRNNINKLLNGEEWNQRQIMWGYNHELVSLVCVYVLTRG